MNEERSGIVVKLNFTNEFSPNPSTTLYVHQIEFDNGDRGTIYTKTKLPNEIGVGENIVYIYTNPEKTKLKFVAAVGAQGRIVSPPNQSPQINYGAAPQQRTHYAKSIGAPQNNNNRKYMSAAKGLEGNIGYAFSYAKDHVGNTFNLYKDILVKRMDEKIQRMLSSGKYEYLSDIPLRELFDEEMELFLTTARYNFEQMGSDELRAYDGSVNVEQELRAKNELTILAPLRKEVVGSGNAKGNSTVFVNTTEEAMKIVDDADFDIEEPKEDDFLKEMNEDFNSLTEDKKGKKKK